MHTFEILEEKESFKEEVAYSFKLTVNLVA